MRFVHKETIPEVARLAREWFERHLMPAEACATGGLHKH
jgi:hypothetical protein